MYKMSTMAPHSMADPGAIALKRERSLPVRFLPERALIEIELLMIEQLRYRPQVMMVGRFEQK